MYFLIGIFGETLSGSEVLLLHVDDPGLDPYFDILVGGIEDVDVHVIGSTAICALLVDPDEFSEYVTAQRSVVIGVEDAMFVENVLTDLSEGVPLVLEGVLTMFQVLLEAGTTHFRVALEGRLHVGNVFVGDVLFLQVVQDIAVMLSVKTEKHLRVVQVAGVLYWLAHALEYRLVQLHLVNLQLHVHQQLQQKLKFLFQCLQRLRVLALYHQSVPEVLLDRSDQKELLRLVALLDRTEIR